MLSEDLSTCAQCGQTLPENHSQILNIPTSTHDPVPIKTEPPGHTTSSPDPYPSLCEHSHRTIPSIISDDGGESSGSLHPGTHGLFPKNLLFENSSPAPVVISPGMTNLNWNNSTTAGWPGAAEPVTGTPKKTCIGVTLEVVQVRAGSCRLMSDVKVMITDDRVLITHPGECVVLLPHGKNIFQYLKYSI